MKLTMYGAPICGDCVAVKEALQNLSMVELDYRNITESTAVLKEFLKYRDSEEMFESIKADGKIGIPFFILEDGTKTFDIETYVDVKIEAATIPANACSLDGKGNC